MRKLALLLLSAALLFLVACGSEEGTSGDSAEETIDIGSFESRVSEAVSQMDTEYEILLNEENDDGNYTIMLAEDAGFVIDDNKVTASHLNPIFFDEVKQLFTILVGSVDESLSLGDRNLVLNDLGISDDILLQDYTEVITHNDIQYTVHGDNESITLRAELK